MITHEQAEKRMKLAQQKFYLVNQYGEIITVAVRGSTLVKLKGIDGVLECRRSSNFLAGDDNFYPLEILFFSRQEAELSLHDGARN